MHGRCAAVGNAVASKRATPEHAQEANLVLQMLAGGDAVVCVNANPWTHPGSPNIPTTAHAI